MENSNKQLIYIKVPDEYALAAKIPGFDSSIPFPLLLTDEGNEFTAESISEEMILAGMLHVFAYERDNRHIAYYRDIFKELRPNILEEMTNAVILKIKNADFDLAEQLLFALEGLFPEHIQTKLNVALLMDERSHFYEQAGAEDYAEYYTDKAFQAYKEVLAAEPPLPDAFFNAGFFFIRQKNFPKAKKKKKRLKKYGNFWNFIQRYGMRGFYWAGLCAVRNDGRMLRKHFCIVWSLEKRLQKNWLLPIAISAMSLPSA